MRFISKLYPFFAITLLSSGLIFSACSKGSQQRHNLIDVQGSDNLTSSEFASFSEIIALDATKATTLYPTSNAQFNRIVHYKKSQANQYQIKYNTKEYTCHYSYDQATKETSFTKETTTNDQGKDIIEYKYQTTIIPINATYTTIPNITEIKLACDKQISLLNKVGDQVTINFTAAWKKFQTLMSEQLVNLVSLCSRSGRIEGRRCVSASFSRSLKSEGNPIDTYAFTINFTWQLDSAKQTNTSIEIEVAPSLYYLEDYGILNLSADGLPLQSSQISFPPSSIQALKLSGF